ncbi:putative P450 monooxygenase [Cladophialophora carrionii]|uniref:Putative P450 monooxygenase n=1 Tax=Cladophialophora carrionii TaxID=86049 RepID=A0A1C1CB29_9EURO|nr:putative P450 monooxygenase [Cladophialophora carrionii]
MALRDVLLSPLVAHPLLTLFLLPVVLVLRSVYRISPLHPLSHIPGPLLPRLSSLWLTYHAWIGDEASVVDALHQRYGTIVRNGPNSVDISDGAALAAIYTERGGFAKTKFYENFALPDGVHMHNSIFSETDPLTRAPRAKAVAVLFSTSNLRQGQDLIYACVDKFVARLAEGKKSSQARNGAAGAAGAGAGAGAPLNILNLTRGLAVDAVSSYLLGKSYGALSEDSNAAKHEKKKTVVTVRKELAAPMSAAGMVDTFVAVGRFWYLPSWAFKLVECWDAWWNANDEVTHSLARVDEFVAGVVSDAEASIINAANNDNADRWKDDKKITDHPLTSYPARLLQAGFTPSETRAQCKDLIFAGSDSTGMNLATILFMLAKHPDCHRKARDEVLRAGNGRGHPGFDELQSLPYLRGVVKEGLRLSMANPSRLPRVVPPGGWTFKDTTHFPAGTEVSCTPYSLHLNPDVFPDPCAFKPERWIDPSEAMMRDAIPFGLGSRQCIARNLATVELYCAVARVLEAGILQGAATVKSEIDILEWFNSKVVGERIDLVWQ